MNYKKQKNNLAGKRIVLILPKFHGYEDYIIRELKRQKAKVYPIYENLEWISYIYRFVHVYVKCFEKVLQNIYYKWKLNQIKTDMDYVFVIRGSSLNKSIMDDMHSRWKKCSYIIYQWDSVKRNPNAAVIAECFDYQYTFDRIDAETFHWIYRPLFYVSKRCSKKRKFDIAYICTLHTERLKIYEEIQKLQDKRNIRNFAYIYVKKLIYYKRKYLDKDKRFVSNTGKQDIFFKPLGLLETNRIYSESKIVVDYTDPAQNGLTMRTIESLGHHCKLVTNNRLVAKEDFYNPANIYIYDEGSFSVPGQFLEQDYVMLPKEMEEKYSLPIWIREILIH